MMHPVRLIKLLMDQTSRSSKNELLFYFEDVFGESGSDLSFETSTPAAHPKYDRCSFTFTYNGTMFVKVFVSPGEDSSKTDNGSLSVSVFILDSKAGRSFSRKETNAFYDPNSKKVLYDPVLRNGKDTLSYVKSVLSDDKDGSYADAPVPGKPRVHTSPRDLVTA